MTLYLRINIIVFFSFLSFSAWGQDCLISERIEILPLDTTNLILDVSGLTNDDLSGDQGICGVRLFFRHGQVGNIRMTLISPSGEEVILVGPGTVSSGLTQLVNWNVLFVQCGIPAVPDMGFDAVWDNDQAWMSLSTYDGIYHPNNGCLEDFMMGSANGTWTLQIENLGPLAGEIEFFELIFCDTDGLSCEPCLISAGDFSDEFYTTCQQDLTLRDMTPFLDAIPIIDDHQDYTFVLSEADEIIAFDDEMADLDTLSPGFYSICGLAYDTSDFQVILELMTISGINALINTNNVCADLTTPCFTLQIAPVDHIVELDTTVCDGDTLSFLGIQIFDDIDTNILRANQITCDSLIIIHAEKVTVEVGLNASQDTVFCGTPIFLNASSSTTNGDPLDFSWSTMDGNYVSTIGPIVQVDRGGTYRLDVESTGCIVTDSVTIAESDTFFIELVSDPLFCVEDTFMVEVNSSVVPDSIRIMGPDILEQRDNTFTTINDGTYSVDIFFGTCRTTDSITLDNQATLINIQVSSTVIDCANQFSEITVTTDASNPTFNYSGPETVSDMTNQIQVSTSGMYTVTVIDENDCEAMLMFEVVASQDFPDYRTSDIERLCTEPFVELPLIIFSPLDSVLWIGPEDYMSRDQNPNATLEGTYYVTIYGSNGCAVDDSLELRLLDVPVDFEIIQDVNCEDESIVLCASTIGDSIIWMLDNRIISRDSCLTIVEGGTYDVTVFRDQGCLGMESALIPALEEYFFTINNIPETLNLTCQDSVLTLMPDFVPTQSDVLIEWTLDGNSFSDQSDIQISTPGQYILTTESTLGCSISDTVDVSETIPFYEEFTIDFIQIDPACVEDTASLVISGISSWDDYSVLLNNSPVQNPEQIALPEGFYEIEISDENGCVLSYNSEVIYPDALFLDIGQDIIGEIGDVQVINIDTNIDEDAIANFVWSDSEMLSCSDCLDPTVTLQNDAVLSLMIIDTVGCIAQDSISLIIEEKDLSTDIYIPNVFCTECDGDNSVFMIYPQDGISRVYDLRIYDRWGNLLIFRSELGDIDNFIWDGTYKGKFVEQGVYIFRAKVTTQTNIEKEIIVPITLLR